MSKYLLGKIWSPGPLPTLLARLAALLGLVATYTYASSDLTLAHYDAKAHLVVSRRIFDSLTPGWEQIGAVWLPLPHLLNMLPVQIDHLYRTGGFGIAVSVLSHALATGSIAATVLLLTGSRAGASLAAALFATNPNVLYLQSTPMTEPLLFGLTTLQAYLFVKWIVGPPSRHEDSAASAGQAPPKSIGWVTVLACLTRYEAWAITASLYAASVFAWWRRGRSLVDVLRVHARLAIYPIATVLAFSLFSRLTVQEWFVTGGFFVPDESLLGKPQAVYDKITEGVGILGGGRLTRLAQIATIVVALLGVAFKRRAAMLVSLALFASAALPIAAYLSGHPFRLRYEVPLIVGCAVAVGLAVGLTRGWAHVVALIAFAAVTIERPPFDPRAAVVAEAQVDANRHERRKVTNCLRMQYRGGVVMASMGSLGHYMHELALAGFDIRDFLHEGNGPLWDSAFTRGPSVLAEWVLVEEQAEGGDAVIQRHRRFSRLLRDYDRACSSGGVSLYRRRF